MSWQEIGRNQSLDSSHFSVPQNSNVEIVVFGRGYGECVLLKCRDSYIVIDSFLNPETRNPIVLDYFNYLHIPYSSIKVVVITHWHNDHIKGATKILTSVGTSVKLLINPIISDLKFRKYIEKQKLLNDFVRNNIDEFSSVMDLIKEEKVNTILATANKVVISEKDTKLVCLSPQDSESSSFYINHELNRPGDATIINDNLLSLVLLFQFKTNGLQNGILLGGDMQNTKKPRSGWNGIVDNFSQFQYPQSFIFKIPHHGSKNGYCQQVWETMLEKDPMAIVTAFNRSCLPKDNVMKKTIFPKSGSLTLVGETTMKKDKELLRTFSKANFSIEINSYSYKCGIFRVIADGDRNLREESTGPVFRFV